VDVQEGRRWYLGSKPEGPQVAYSAVVRPILTYGAKVQRSKDSRAYPGAMRTAPTRALEVLLNLMPLDIFIKMEAVRATFDEPSTSGFVWTLARVKLGY